VRSSPVLTCPRPHSKNDSFTAKAQSAPGLQKAPNPFLGVLCAFVVKTKETTLMNRTLMPVSAMAVLTEEAISWKSRSPLR
jgi:hypothetical protein